MEEVDELEEEGNLAEVSSAMLPHFIFSLSSYALWAILAF